MNDVQFLKHPLQWPNLVCPLKRRAAGGGAPEIAIYQPGYVAYNVSVWHITDGATWQPTTPEQLIEAGWEVD